MQIEYNPQWPNCYIGLGDYFIICTFVNNDKVYQKVINNSKNVYKAINDFNEDVGYLLNKTNYANRNI